MIGREDEVRAYRDRVYHFQVVAVVFLCLILLRLVYLQILKGDELRKYSEANRLKKERLYPTRGIIFDRQGKVIVDNRAAFDVVLLSQYYPFKPDVNARLARALQMPLAELEKKLAKSKKGPSFYPVLLKADVPKEVIAAIEMDAEGFPGVDIEATVQRRYPYGDIAAQLLGYVGEVDPRDLENDPDKQPGDYIGKMGIERYHDGFLRGVAGVGYVEVDAMGRRRRSESAEKLLGYIAQTDPVPGNNIYLTLDADLEVAAANAMKAKGYNGTVIALDPRNGELLALVNSPSYDPGRISGREVDPKVWSELRNNKERPLRNRAIQDHYPPGSTFKTFVAIAALAEGVATLGSSVHCSGGMQFGNRRFACWSRHGGVDFTRSIKESCDVFYYKYGSDLGIDRIAKYARMFGFGSPTGIKLPGETRGLVADSAWKKKVSNSPWQPGETLSVAIGQGALDATPIQLVTAYAAIANGGFLYRPFLVRRIEGRSGETIKEFQPELVRKIEIPDPIFDAVKEGLFRVINEPGGTAFLSKSKKTVLSGKTGTAQVKGFSDITKLKCESMPYEARHHGLFVGYAPRENPEIAVVVIAEHGCHGYSAARIVREVVDAYMEKQMLLKGAAVAEKQVKPEAGSRSAAGAEKARPLDPLAVAREAQQKKTAGTRPTPPAQNLAPIEGTVSEIEPDREEAVEPEGGE